VPARARPGPRVRPGGDDRFATRGHPAATAAVERMIRVGAPHALLVIGPRSVGKTTLALDLAAGLLCHADDPAARPCGTCRSCRLVDAGEHQDLHRLAPEGPGRQVRIGDPEDPEPGTVRHLVRELARLPVEGTRRVAVVEGADRLNEDAQNALLKTLEEPPAGATLVLCADEPERLLPTVRSRSAVLRLGPVAVRAMEELLAEHGVGPPQSGRLARLADGRPGRALALAAAPEAVAAREELARSLLDLVDVGIADRLVAGRALLLRAADLARADDVYGEDPPPSAEPSAASKAVAEPEAAPGGAAAADGKPARGTPAERRLAAWALLGAWTAVARDLAVAAVGSTGAIRDIALLDELTAVAPRVASASVVAFLGRLVRAAELLEANANPELLVDVLVVAWPSAHLPPAAAPSPARAATGPGVP
jgi:DNA polymerase III delta' subunit